MEDNKINQQLARRMLEQAGFSVTVAEHGKQALEILETRTFPVILMDIRMPVMGGIETIRHIRNDDRLKTTKVIALSAGVLDKEVEEAMAAGFDHYLTKPIDFEELNSLLGRVIAMEDQPPQSPDDYVVRGVNFGSALESHGGDMEFLITLTTDFISFYGDTDETLKAHLDNSELEPAERLVHNIAGLSGTFGATSLMDTSRRVEQELQQSGEVSNDSFTALKADLENFIEAIREFQNRAA